MNKKSTATHQPSINKLTSADFLAAAWKYPSDVWYTVLIPVSSIINNTLIPFYIGKILASLSQHNPTTNTYVIYLVIASILGVVANHFGFSRFFGLQPKVMASLDEKALHTLLKRSVGFHNNRISGKLVTDAVAYANSWQQLSNALVMQIVPFVLSLVLGIGIVAINSWQLGLMVFVMTVTVLGIAIRQTIATTPLREVRHNARRSMIAHFSDTIINNQTVKTFAAESREMNRHSELGNELRYYRTRDWLRIANDGSKRIGILLAFEVGFILLVIHLVHENPNLLGIGIFTFSYALNLGNKLFDIGSMFRNVEDAYLEAGDTTQLIHDKAEVVDEHDAKEMHVSSGSLVFDHVGFRYNDAASQDMVFKDLNLLIKAGERVGVVGPSGGGKSTFTRMLLRFDDIQSGRISIDGQNIAEVTQDSLRSAVSYVAQEPLLFHRSIAENIAYGNATASMEDIHEAARKAYAFDFIQELPQGFDTVVGERGVKLSGGQRQRVAIARAILKDAPILVLDEATSALDSESEVYIQSALWELMQQRTAIVIAHRLSTIQKLDRILVLVDGQIVEDGTHAKLLKQKGMYANLWAHQSGGFIED